MFNEMHQAIRDRAVVELSYRGQDLRVVEPRMLNMFPDGKRVLYAYQLDGFSRSGLVKGWKTFDLAHISRFRRTGEHFSADRPNPSPEEAQDMIENSLARGASDAEVINALERAGIPRGWVVDQISKWRASLEGEAS